MQLRLQPQRSNTIDRIHRSKNPLRTPDEILKLNDYLTNSRLHPIYQTEYPVEIWRESGVQSPRSPARRVHCFRLKHREKSAKLSSSGAIHGAEASYTRAWHAHARVTEKASTRATHPYTGIHARTLHRIETRTSLLTLTHEWEKRYSWPEKKRHQPDLVCTWMLAGFSASLASCLRTRIRVRYVGVGIGSRAANERVCAVGRLCATYAVCCNLYSARLQFYLLHVFVANRAHTVYVKPRCWHVHATFPFQNRFWRRAPRRLSQRRRRFSRQGCIYSTVRHSSSSNLYTFFFFFFIYLYYFIPCIRIEY